MTRAEYRREWREKWAKFKIDSTSRGRMSRSLRRLLWKAEK